MILESFLIITLFGFVAWVLLVPVDSMPHWIRRPAERGFKATRRSIERLLRPLKGRATR